MISCELASANPWKTATLSSLCWQECFMHKSKSASQLPFIHRRQLFYNSKYNLILYKTNSPETWPVHLCCKKNIFVFIVTRQGNHVDTIPSTCWSYHVCCKVWIQQYWIQQPWIQQSFFLRLLSTILGFNITCIQQAFDSTAL